MEVLGELVEGDGVGEELAGVVVDPAGFLLGDVGVAGDLDGGDGDAEWGASAGGEEDHVRAGGGEGGGGDEVVAGTVDEGESAEFGGDGLAVAAYFADGCRATLLDAAERFFFEGGDAAGFVSGGGVFVDGLVVLAEVVFEVVDEIDEIAEDLFVGRAVHEKLFRAEHLGDFGEDAGAARGAVEIHEASDERVRRDAGVSVAGAAFSADNQFVRGQGLAFELGRVVCEIAEFFEPGFDFVFDILRIEESDAVRIDVPDGFKLEAHLVVLAAESHHEYAPRVRVVDESGEQLLRVVHIVAELRAAVRVVEGEEAVDGRVRKFLFGEFTELLRRHVHAADGIDDPDFVADADLALGTREAFKGGGCDGGAIRFVRIPGVVEVVSERGAQVVCVDVCAFRDVFGGQADGVAVFDDRRAGWDGGEGDLVAFGDAVLIGEHHGDVVVWMYLEGFGHGTRFRNVLGVTCVV